MYWISSKVNFLFFERYCDENKKTKHHQRIYFVKHTSDQGLVFRVYEEHSKLNKKANKFPKEDIQIASMWKNAQYHLLSENYKLKPQWNTTTHLLGWLKLKKLTTPNVDKGLEHWNSYIADRNVEWYCHFDKQFSSFLKINYLLTLWFSHSTTR